MFGMSASISLKNINDIRYAASHIELNGFMTEEDIFKAIENDARRLGERIIKDGVDSIEEVIRIAQCILVSSAMLEQTSGEMVLEYLPLKPQQSAMVDKLVLDKLEVNGVEEVTEILTVVSGFLHAYDVPTGPVVNMLKELAEEHPKD